MRIVLEEVGPDLSAIVLWAVDHRALVPLELLRRLVVRVLEVHEAVLSSIREPEGLHLLLLRLRRLFRSIDVLDPDLAH